MGDMKLAMAAVACFLLCTFGTALAASGAQDEDNSVLHVMQATSTGAGSAPVQQVPGMGASQQYGGEQYGGEQYGGAMSSASEQQFAGGPVDHVSNYDWLSPGGVGSVHYYSWGGPYSRYWHYPAYSYRYYTYDPFYYNDFDPWWVANVYGPFRTTYYWYSW